MTLVILTSKVGCFCMCGWANLHSENLVLVHVWLGRICPISENLVLVGVWLGKSAPEKLRSTIEQTWLQ